MFVERPLAAGVFELQQQEEEEECVLLNPSLTEDPPLSADRQTAVEGKPRFFLISPVLYNYNKFYLLYDCALTCRS